MESEPLNRKLQVFFSHLTVESKFADQLKGYLIKDFIGMVEVFVASDATSIPVGTRWLAELFEALRGAHLQLILCSRESVERPWIQYEAGAAHMRGIPTIPLCHSGLAVAQLAVPLSESEGIMLTDPTGL